MRKLTLFGIFIMVSNFLFGQERKAILGLEIGPKLTTTAYKQTGMGFGAGAFADLPVYRKFGFSTGLRFVQLNYDVPLMCTSGPDYESYCPYKINRFYALELPVGMDLDLSVRQNASWKVHLKSNYVLGRTLASESILVKENGRVKGSLGRWDNPITYTG